MKNSFVELNARERVHALLDAKSGRELIDPFDFWRKRGRDRYGREIPRWRDR